MKFDEMNLHPQVLTGIRVAGFTECMEVQERVLNETLKGKDVMVQSKTGSGKTAAFLLTFLEEYLCRKEQGLDSRCLIIAPTRELAQQIYSDAKILSSGIKGLTIGCFYGGTGYDKQEKQLKLNCSICIGTPGRLIEYLKNGKLPGASITTFVIDEADRLFDMGFYPDIRTVFRLLPQRDNRQTMLFSATLEMRVRELAWEFMNEPSEIDLEPDTITVDKISQELYHVAKNDKFMLFLQILTQIKPESALVFTNSRHMSAELAIRLKLNGWNADHLSGDMTQRMREKALEKIKNGKTAILVATDVAARGLQIDDLPLVVNYDVPEDYENYVHRIGRTARAGKSGRAITFADEEFVYGLEAIEKYIKMKIPVIWPENLPEVEDMSLGKSWKEMPSKKPKPSKSTNPSTNPVKKERVEPSKSLGKMTEQERLEYYRKKYGFEPKEKIRGMLCLPLHGILVGIDFILCFVLGIVPSLVFRMIGLRKLGNNWIYFFGGMASRFVLKVLDADVEVSGEVDVVRDLLKQKMPVCFISNHTSLLDVLAVLGTLRLKVGFFAKSEFRYTPLLNIIIPAFHTVFITRQSIRQSKRAMRKGERNIYSGYPMVIYPEGTRSKTGKIGPFKHGSFRLATETSSLIVPITVKGFRRCCEDRVSPFQGKSKCYISLGAPIQAPDANDREAVSAMIEKVQKQIIRTYASLGKERKSK